MCHDKIRPSITIKVDVPSYLRPPRTAAVAGGRIRHRGRPEPRPLPRVPAEQQEELDRLHRQIDRSFTIPLQDESMAERASINDDELDTTQQLQQSRQRRRNRRSMDGPTSVEYHPIYGSTWILDQETQRLTLNPSHSPDDRNYRHNMTTGELTPIRRGGRMSIPVEEEGPELRAY